MKLKKILQNIFKKFFQFLFKIIYGNIIYVQSNLKHKNILISKIENEDIKKYDNSYYHAYTILNGRVYTDHVENVATFST